MTKVSYYECVTKDDKKHLIYGTTKKAITEVAKRMGLPEIKELKELNFKELSSTKKEEELKEVREKCRKHWDQADVKPRKAETKENSKKEGTKK